jgi:hypothetical protein
MDIRHWPFTKIILGCVAASLAAYYCRALNLGALELLRFVAGALALWVPIGGWLYLLLRNEVPDRIVRLSFSAGGSYALTTLFYFAAATLHCNWLFYSVEAVAGAGLIYYAIKNKLAFESLLKRFRRFDWVLAALVAASMVASIPAQSVWRRDAKTGGMIYDGLPDHLYHVGQAYELSRTLAETKRLGETESGKTCGSVRQLRGSFQPHATCRIESDFLARGMDDDSLIFHSCN